MTRPCLALAFLAAIVCQLPVQAHHSFGAYYFESQSVSLEGVLVQFEYKNPHAWVYVAVQEPQGPTVTYEAEWGNPGRLSKQGVTKDTLKAGDRVILTGSPGRNASERRIHLKKIERPSDGWRWTGSRDEKR